MDKNKIDKMREEISKEPDLEYRNKLLKELKEYEASINESSYKTKMENKITSWEEEAKLLLAKNIKDPAILATISKHHARNELLDAEEDAELSAPEVGEQNPETEEIKLIKNNKVVPVTILSLIFFFIIMVIVVAVFA